jgi:hypothetical protein
MLEFQQFNLIWDKKMTEYELHAEELVEAMKERHSAELRGNSDRHDDSDDDDDSHDDDSHDDDIDDDDSVDDD